MRPARYRMCIAKTLSKTGRGAIIGKNFSVFPREELPAQCRAWTSGVETRQAFSGVSSIALLAAALRARESEARARSPR